MCTGSEFVIEDLKECRDYLIKALEAIEKEKDIEHIKSIAKVTLAYVFDNLF